MLSRCCTDLQGLPLVSWGGLPGSPRASLSSNYPLLSCPLPTQHAGVTVQMPRDQLEDVMVYYRQALLTSPNDADAATQLRYAEELLEFEVRRGRERRARRARLLDAAAPRAAGCCRRRRRCFLWSVEGRAVSGSPRPRLEPPTPANCPTPQRPNCSTAGLLHGCTGCVLRHQQLRAGAARRCGRSAALRCALCSAHAPGSVPDCLAPSQRRVKADPARPSPASTAPSLLHCCSPAGDAAVRRRHGPVPPPRVPPAVRIEACVDPPCLDPLQRAAPGTCARSFITA